MHLLRERYHTEKELIEACQAGKRAAQEQLYQKYKGMLFGICLRYAPDRTSAEDLLQEGFVKIFFRISSYDHKGSFEGWMKRIMVNTALDEYRKKNRQIATDTFTEGLHQDLAFEMPAEGSMETLVQLIQELPDGCRTVFNLYEVEGYAHKEIAEMLGISEGASRSQLSYAKTKLSERLKILFPKTYAVVR